MSLPYTTMPTTKLRCWGKEPFMLRRRLAVIAGAATLAMTLTAAPSFAATTTGTVHTKLTCDPSTKTKGTPPAVGASATFQAGSAGSVVITRSAAATLTVASATPASGWTDTVTTATGPRVRVLFRNAGTKELQHFGIAISSRGTFTIESTSHCHH